MPLWGRNDQSVTANSSTTKETSNGAPMGTWALVKGDQVHRVNGANAHFGNTSPGTRAGVDVNMFGNTTMGAFVPNVAVGVFGVDATEVGISGGLASLYVTSSGSGYSANATVTITFANGTTNVAYANSTVTLGHVTALTANITTAISGGNPSVTIAAPAAINIPANTTTIPVPGANNITSNSTGVNSTADFILLTSANSNYLAGDRVYYTVPADNTAITGLTANTYYYISFSNTTGLKLALTSGGANLAINATAFDETHTLTGDASFIKITTANTKWQVNDRFYYGVPAANTAFGGLTGNSYYYISFANTTGVKISSTSGGANLLFGVTTIPTAASPETHTFTGDRATGYATLGGGANKGIAHAGWVLRTEGQGGRAGRVQYETLVAMGSLGATDAKYGSSANTTDASDDKFLPDS